MNLIDNEEHDGLHLRFLFLLDPEMTLQVKRGKFLRICLFFSPVDLLQNYLLPKALPWLLLVDCLFYNNLYHIIFFKKIDLILLVDTLQKHKCPFCY